MTPVLADPTDDWVIVHELAHQWWGNLISCATWQDFWLNEGITTFMTAAWKEHRFGRAAYDAEHRPRPFGQGACPGVRQAAGLRRALSVPWYPPGADPALMNRLVLGH